MQKVSVNNGQLCLRMPARLEHGNRFDKNNSPDQLSFLLFHRVVYNPVKESSPKNVTDLSIQSLQTKRLVV